MRGRLSVLAALAGALMLSGTGLPARADCFSSCLGSDCSGVNYGNGIGCKLRSNMCMQQCRDGGSGGGGGTYGALAYSGKTGDYGFSYGYTSRAEAERRAKRECGQSDCEIAAWYSRACGAIAVGDEGKWGGGSGDTEPQAREDAKNDCVKDGGKNCEILVAKCTR